MLTYGWYEGILGWHHVRIEHAWRDTPTAARLTCIAKVAGFFSTLGGIAFTHLVAGWGDAGDAERVERRG